ncbi:MAG: hypothetical protein IPO92_14785 [Saprospiraceae bacterium]|nr:hypothetical protein [Saprospiraceae bacterium]
MKILLAYFLLIMSMGLPLIGNSQYGEVSTINICPNATTGSATIKLYRNAFEPDWLPPFTAEIENLDTGQEWEGPINIVEGNFLKGTFNNLSAGNYEVTIFVKPRCFLTFEFTIQVNTAVPNINQKIEPEYCGNKDGSISLTSPDLTLFTWGPPINKAELGLTSDVKDLKAGVYEVEVREFDVLACPIKKYFIVKNEMTHPFTLSGLPSRCANLGSITVNLLSPNIKPDKVTYKWSNGATTQAITNLRPGNYIVTATYGNCQFISNELEIENISGSIEKLNPICGESNGRLTFYTNEIAQPGIKFLWSTGSNSSSITGLGSGSYGLTVTVGTCVKVFNNLVLKGSLIKSLDLGCQNDKYSLTAIPHNGIDASKIKYLWRNGLTTKSIQNLLPGGYELFASTIDGCGDVLGESISPFVFESTQNNPVTCGDFSYSGVISLNFEFWA